MMDTGVEDRYRILFANNIAGVSLSTPEGRVVDCNDVLVEIFGLAHARSYSRTVPGIFYLDKQDRNAAIQPDRVIENHLARELPFRDKTGRPIWLRYTRAVVSRSNGRRELLLVTAMDVTELRQLRAQFRELSKEIGTWPTLRTDPSSRALAEELATHLQTVNQALRPENLEVLRKPELQQFIQSVERMKVLMEELVMNQVNIDPEG